MVTSPTYLTLQTAFLCLGHKLKVEDFGFYWCCVLWFHLKDYLGACTFFFFFLVYVFRCVIFLCYLVILFGFLSMKNNEYVMIIHINDAYNLSGSVVQMMSFERPTKR